MLYPESAKTRLPRTLTVRLFKQRVLNKKLKLSEKIKPINIAMTPFCQMDLISLGKAQLQKIPGRSMLTINKTKNLIKNVKLYTITLFFWLNAVFGSPPYN
jgi:hypothetical protein